jgi:hypothetical protein
VFYSCSQKPDAKTESQIPSGITIKKDSVQDDDLESKILNAVMSLPEVEASNTYIDSISFHQKGIAGIIDAPENGETDYGVRVGYNGNDRFEVYHFFYVNPKTMQVKVLDVITDSVMLYEDWHKLKSEEK